MSVHYTSSAAPARWLQEKCKDGVDYGHGDLAGLLVSVAVACIGVVASGKLPSGLQQAWGQSAAVLFHSCASELTAWLRTTVRPL